MEKHENFKKLIEVNRKMLLSLGFDAATVSLWASGKRVPYKSSAKKISEALAVPIEDIPIRVSVVR